jgi:hypothetical protein
MDLPTALVLVIGVTAAEAIPGYERMSGACKGADLERADTLAACRRLAVALRRGDTYITEMIGIAIAKRVWTEGSPEYQDALEARRVARYRMDAYIHVSTASNWDNAQSERYLQMLESHRTEQEEALAEIMQAGVDPDPPKDWKDPVSITH